MVTFINKIIDRCSNNNYKTNIGYKKVLTKRERQVLKLREEKGHTQEEVAKLLDISQAAVSKFECNAHKKIRNAKITLKIADDLGVEVEDRVYV